MGFFRAKIWVEIHKGREQTTVGYTVLQPSAMVGCTSVCWQIWSFNCESVLMTSMYFASRYPQSSLCKYTYSFSTNSVSLHCSWATQLIEIINNKARHNLINVKCRWRPIWLDGSVSFREPLGQTKVMQIRQGEALNHQGAITHEVCRLAAQTSSV